MSYSYLWHAEAVSGRDEGVKDRPVVVVIAVATSAGRTELTVVPVTTRPPHAKGEALEIPERIKAHLGLGADRCWIVCTEYNRFLWPGPDIRPIMRSDQTPFYGAIPGKLLEQVRALIAAHAAAGGVKVTRRTE